MLLCERSALAFQKHLQNNDENPILPTYGLVSTFFIFVIFCYQAVILKKL